MKEGLMFFFAEMKDTKGLAINFDPDGILAHLEAYLCIKRT